MTQVPGQAPNNTPAGQAPDGSQPPAAGDGASGGKSIDTLPADVQALIRELRQEAASHRTKASASAAELEALKAERLSAEEKRELAYKQALEASEIAKREAAEARIALQVEREAAKLGIVDPETARLLIEKQVAFKDDGSSNVGELLTKLVEAKPYLRAVSNAQPVLPGSGSPTNPPKGGKLTREDVAKMSRSEILARYDEVKNVLYGK